MLNQSIIEQIAALIKQAAEPEIATAMELAAGEYQRGRADERKATLLALGIRDEVSPRVMLPGASPRSEVSAPQQQNRTTPERNAEERLRAPKGSVRALVEKALGAKGGLTPQDILSFAETDFERMVKAASVRSELRSGFDAGRYHESRGQWFLIPSSGVSVGTEGDLLRGEPSVPRSEKGGDNMPPP